MEHVIVKKHTYMTKGVDLMLEKNKQKTMTVELDYRNVTGIH